jgi:hypothetical protein
LPSGQFLPVPLRFTGCKIFPRFARMACMNGALVDRARRGVLDARGGNRRACLGMSLFTVACSTALQQKVRRLAVQVNAAMQHANLLNRAPEMSKQGIESGRC